MRIEQSNSMGANAKVHSIKYRDSGKNIGLQTLSITTHFQFHLKRQAEKMENRNYPELFQKFTQLLISIFKLKEFWVFKKKFKVLSL